MGDSQIDPQQSPPELTSQRFPPVSGMQRPQGGPCAPEAMPDTKNMLAHVRRREKGGGSDLIFLWKEPWSKDYGPGGGHSANRKRIDASLSRHRVV